MRGLLRRVGYGLAATSLFWWSSAGMAHALANRSFGAENGTLSGTAAACTDATANGSSAVQFGRPCTFNAPALTSADMVKSTINIHTGDAKMLADMTGDGKLDWIVGGNTNGEPLDIFPYPYNPAVKTTVVNSQEEFTTDAEAADMDGDGDIDLVTPDGCSLGQIKVSINGGNGASWTTSTIGTIAGHCLKDVEIADFDKNGRNDIAIRYDSVVIFYQTAAGVYTPTTVQAAAAGAEGMDSGDIDGDGDVDLVVKGAWLENPGSNTANWASYTIGNADAAFRATTADFNNDGKLDVAYSCSECGTGGNGNTGINNIYVYLNNTAKTSWTQFSLGTMNFAHTIEAADFNGDGDTDLLVGQLTGYAGSASLMTVYDNAGSGASWMAVSLTTNTLGVHIGRAGDIDGDGDIDLVGSNFSGNTTLNIYTNQTNRPGSIDYAGLSMTSGLGIPAPRNQIQTPTTSLPTCSARSLDAWNYINVDNTRSGTQALWGLGMGDFDGDGDGDIVAGNRYYRNPGGTMTGSWQNGGGLLNASLITDIDGDAFKDVIDLGSGISWKEWNGSGFSIVAGPVAIYGQQGYKAAQIIPGGPPEIVYSYSNGGASNANGVMLASFTGTTITTVSISNQTADEGIGTGDIDGDGLIDIAIGDGTNIAWFKNPGGGAGNWTKNILGQITHGDGNGGFTDRTEIADIDNDGKLDVVTSEETFGFQADTYWFKNPGGTATGAWARSTIATQDSTNSMDVADMDDDGDTDVITGEHVGALTVAVWENQNNGATWVKHIVSTGKESHLGARVADLDNDGDKEIVSIAYDAPQNLHLWRNDSTASCTQTACSSLPDIGLGKADYSVNLEATGLYRLWVRMWVPNAVVNAVGLNATSVNGSTTNCNTTIGDSSSIASGQWTWVSMRTGNNSLPLTMSLPAGSTSFSLLGKEAGVKIDHILLVRDTACIPTGTDGSNCAGSSQTGDSAPPSVNLTAPVNGATVSGTVSLTANASDNVAVNRVEFFDGTTLISSDTTSPYSASWDTVSSANGSHTLTAKAYDSTGNTATSTAVSVTVNNLAPDTTAPSVSLTAPANGATVSASTTVSATATDNIGVTKVEFYDGTNLLGSDTTSPYSLTWDTTTASNGSHTITAKAFDAANNTSTSAAAIVTVSNFAAPGNPKDNYLTFDGAGDRVTLGTLNPTGTALTVEAWIKNNDIANCGTNRDCRILSKATNTSTGTTTWDLLTTQVSSQTRLQFRLRIGSTLYTVTSNSTVNMAQGQWYHVAATYTGSAMNVYINGQLVGTTVVTGSIAGSTSAPVWIGATPTAGSKSWDGGIDEVRIWNVARSQAQIQAAKDVHIINTVSGLVAYYQMNECTGQTATNAVSASWLGILGSSTGTDSADPTWTCPTPDTTAPNTSITAPTAGSSQSGTITISASATDNLAVSRVEFYVDGTLITSDATSPYSISWNTASVSNGSHSLTTKAYDAANNVGTSAAVAITVANAAPDTTPPTTSLTAPTAGSTLSGSVTISANAADNVAVSNVEFYDGTTLIGSDTTSPYSISWNTASASNGSHNLTSKAYDAVGNATTSAIVNVTVSNAAPTGTPKVKRLGFDGTGDHVSLGTGNLNSSAFTIEAWIYSPDLWNCPNEECRIIAKEDAAATANSVFALTTKASATNDTRLQLQIKLNGTMQSFMGTTGDMWTNQWNHVAAVYTGSQVLLYVNGGQVGSFAASGTVSQTSAPLWVGAQPNNAALAWEGEIDDLRIWSIARSQAQIQAAYTTELIGTETGLTSYFRFNDGAGQTALNSAAGGTNGILGNTTAVEAVDPTWK